MASSRFRFALVAASRALQSAPTTAPLAAARPVETQATRRVSAIADVFEPGVSRRILGRRPANISTSTTTTTTSDNRNPESSRPVRPLYAGVSSRVATYETDPRWLVQRAASRESREQLVARQQEQQHQQQQAVALRQRTAREPNNTMKTSERPATSRGLAVPARGVSSRVAAFETDPRWLAQCAQSLERRQDLAARHEQQATRRWRYASRPGADQSKLTSDSDPIAFEPPVQSSATPAVPSRVTDYTTDPKWVAQCAESRDRRQHLASRLERDAERRWRNTSANRCADHSSSPSSNAIAIDSGSPTAASPVARSRVNAHESDPRWLARCAESRERRRELADHHQREAARRWQTSRPSANSAENYARADKTRSARRIKPIEQ